jgi:Skp family chaperone for outer membrane proteins
MSRIPLAGILNAGRAASERSFMQAMQKQQMEAEKARVTQLIAGMNTALEVQEQQLEAVAQATNALAAMTSLQADVQADLAEQLQRESDESQKLAADLLKTQRALEQKRNELLSAIRDTLGDMLTEDHIASGGIWVVGDFKWGWVESRLGSQMWLPCNGNSIPIGEFPDLYAAIGDTYGASSGEGYFKLPDRSQAPGYSAGLPTALNCWIKT